MSPSKINRANVRGRAVGKPPTETHATSNVRDPRIVSVQTWKQAINQSTEELTTILVNSLYIPWLSAMVALGPKVNLQVIVSHMTFPELE
jgi:hypothetical protein